MASKKREKANKRNALLSTGPRSVDGKARVRFNALKHGLTAKQVVLPSERSRDFAAFQLGLLNDLNPIGALGEAYAEEIVAGLWRLRRVFALEAVVYGRGFEMHSDPTDAVTYTFEKHEPALSHLLRYHTSISRTLSRTHQDFVRSQAKRAYQHVPAPAIADADVNFANGASSSEPILKTEPSTVFEPAKAGSEATSEPKSDDDVNVENGVKNPDPRLENELPLAVLVPGKVKSARSKNKKGQWPFLITKSQKVQLRELGFSDAQIAMMKPHHAHRILRLR